MSSQWQEHGEWTKKKFKVKNTSQKHWLLIQVIPPLLFLKNKTILSEIKPFLDIHFIIFHLFLPPFFSFNFLSSSCSFTSFIYVFYSPLWFTTCFFIFAMWWGRGGERGNGGEGEGEEGQRKDREGDKKRAAGTHAQLRQKKRERRKARPAWAWLERGRRERHKRRGRKSGERRGEGERNKCNRKREHAPSNPAYMHAEKTSKN